MEFSVLRLMERFIEERRLLKGVSPATVEWYRNSFRGFRPYLAGCGEVSELAAAFKQAVMAMAAAQTNPITLNDRIHCLNAWLHWLAEERYASDWIRIPRSRNPRKSYRR
jgi:site-specific recombinase XerD